MIDLHARAEERRAIFTNYANGVSLEKIRSAFLRTDEEILREVAFVTSKIREYRFRRDLPPLPCGDEKDIRWNRLALLENLGKLGPKYLASELIIPNVAIQVASTNKELVEMAAEAKKARA